MTLFIDFSSPSSIKFSLPSSKRDFLLQHRTRLLGPNASIPLLCHQRTTAMSWHLLRHKKLSQLFSGAVSNGKVPRIQIPHVVLLRLTDP
uniref:Uncharacterized protein n=1 Tax=Arundo donax TaxID=35708 RepID=A0A0A9CQD2_ARUDO